MMFHKDLEVWKKSIELVTKIYQITKSFPDDERYGLISQMRRAAISIPSNIAEGSARNSDKDMLRFLDVSLGSLAELETQIIIAENLQYYNDAKIYEEINAIAALINGLKKYLQNKTNNA